MCKLLSDMYKNSLIFLLIIIVIMIMIFFMNYNKNNNYNKLPMQGIIENVYVLVKYPYGSTKVMLIDDKNKNYIKQFNNKYFNVLANVFGEYEISDHANYKKLHQSIYYDDIYEKINEDVKCDYVITFIHL